MKILEQIVDYLSQRGALAPEEVSALEEAGFIRRYDDERYDDEEGWPPHEDDDEPPVGRAPKARGGRKRRALKAPALAARLREALRAMDTHLRSLAAIAPVTGNAARWDRIELVARSSPDAVAASMSVAIDRGAVSFRALWDAIAADAHLCAVRPDEHGPAASAYRALLALRDHRDLHRHVWILRRRAISRSYQLLRAQDRAAAALLAVYRGSPALIGKWITREPHPVAYWSFVLLYNAERAASGMAAEAHAGERPARRALPPIADFSRAWARAIQFGGEACSRFLQSFWRAEIRSRQLWASLAPAGSPPAYSESWLRAEIAASSSVATGLGPRLLEAMLALRRFDFEPADRLIAEGFAAPVSVAPPSFQRPLPEELNITLLCPSGWN